MQRTSLQDRRTRLALRPRLQHILPTSMPCRALYAAQPISSQVCSERLALTPPAGPFLHARIHRRLRVPKCTSTRVTRCNMSPVAQAAQESAVQVISLELRIFRNFPHASSECSESLPIKMHRKQSSRRLCQPGSMISRMHVTRGAGSTKRLHKQ